METGIDFSFASITGAQIKAAGYSFVCRYLASSPGKAITAAQVADYRANGLGIVLVFEDYANQALNGYNQGVADAKEALTQANAIGFPADRPIYFAIDFDEQDTPLQNGDIYAYLTGAISVIGKQRVGVYGGYYVVMRCLQNGYAIWGWQTVAWSGGQILSGAHLYQDGNSAFGGGADVNKALKTDFGQWGQGGEENVLYPNSGDLINIYNDTNYLGHAPNENDIAYWCSGTGNPSWSKGADAVWKDLTYSVIDWVKNHPVTVNVPAPTPIPAPAEPTPPVVPAPTPTPPSKLPNWLQKIIDFLSGK